MAFAPAVPRPVEPPTVSRALDRATRLLDEALVPNASCDAEVLLRHVLGWDRASVLTRGYERLRPADASRFFAWIEERSRRRPLQHITGTQFFWRHEFVVGPDVLIPRPETEMLVEASIERLRDVPHPTIVDVGTGSGCIALSLATERQDAEIHAVEVSADALVVARENARRLGLAGRVRFHLGDLLDPVTEIAGGLDLVVSNPPYVDPATASTLEPEVRDHEPAVALFPPGDAYGVYRRLVPQTRSFLKTGAWLILEIGHGMDATVVRICEDEGMIVEGVRRDLQSIPRVIVARRPA